MNNQHDRQQDEFLGPFTGLCSLGLQSNTSIAIVSCSGGNAECAVRVYRFQLTPDLSIKRAQALYKAVCCA